MHSLENAIRNYLHIAVFEARIFFVPSLRFVCACLINYGFGCVFWIGLDEPYQAVENLPNAKTQWKKGVLSIQITIYVWAMSDMWLVWRDSISMRDSIPIPILLWQTSQWHNKHTHTSNPIASNWMAWNCNRTTSAQTAQQEKKQRKQYCLFKFAFMLNVLTPNLRSVFCQTIKINFRIKYQSKSREVNEVFKP